MNIILCICIFAKFMMMMNDDSNDAMMLSVSVQCYVAADGVRDS